MILIALILGLAAYEVAREAVKRARKGEGPTLIECKTYYWRGHYGGEANRSYTCRTKEKIEEWMNKCPIGRYRVILLKLGVIKETDCKKIEKEGQREIEDAIQFAEESPEPEPEDALKGLYQGWGKRHETDNFRRSSGGGFMEGLEGAKSNSIRVLTERR